jgi:hypothetical protein
MSKKIQKNSLKIPGNSFLPAAVAVPPRFLERSRSLDISAVRRSLACQASLKTSTQHLNMSTPVGSGPLKSAAKPLPFKVEWSDLVRVSLRDTIDFASNVEDTPLRNYISCFYLFHLSYSTPVFCICSLLADMTLISNPFPQSSFVPPLLWILTRLLSLT